MERNKAVEPGYEVWTRNEAVEPGYEVWTRNEAVALCYISIQVLSGLIPKSGDGTALVVLHDSLLLAHTCEVGLRN